MSSTLVLYDDNVWTQVWDGSAGIVTAPGQAWLDGKPQYNAGEDPQTVVIVAKHFTGVQAAVQGQSIPRTVQAADAGGGGAGGGGGTGGGGGGCFIDSLMR